jgi:SAM-dependent methyltransferase
MTQQIRPCPVCQAGEATAVYRNAMAAIGGMDLSYTIARCSNCGFHFARQMADDATIGHYYQTASKYDVASKISALDQTRIDTAVGICASNIPKDSMVVDIGCGFGALLSCLQRAGFSNLHGIDPAPNSVERARTLFGLSQIHRGTLDQAHQVVRLQDADLVCLMAVLEHLPQLHANLSQLVPQLKPGCRILVETPGLDLFQAEGSEPLGELSLEHIQFFGRRSLVNLFSGLGLTPLALFDLPLPLLKSGGLFGLFVKPSGPRSEPGRIVEEDPFHFQNYLDRSVRALDAAISRIPHAPFMIYGAGSHTARLLTKLQATHAGLVRGVVDGNPNLHGKTIGDWVIQPPQALQNQPASAVLVSSYRAQNEIAEQLGQHFPGHPVVLMYV